MKLKSFVIVAFAGSLLAAGAADKETPPAGTAPKPFKLAATDDFTLPNGLQVTLAPFGSVPKVAIRVFVDAGALREAPDQIWISKLTAQLIKEGTANRSAERVAQDVADMGGQLEVDSSSDAVDAGGVVLSEYGAKFVTLLADLVTHAALPESELARLKTDLSRELAVEKTQPGSLARERFLKTLFPDQPYGRIYPSEKQLNDLKISDVRAFFQQDFAASRAHLYVVGKFEPGIKQAIQQAFGGWAQGHAEPFPVAKPIRQYSLQQIDRPGAAQSTVYVGLPSTSTKSPDYITLGVMDALLGGSFGSRITSNIRENKGYTYSPRSILGRAATDTYWVETADVTTAVTGPSLHEIFSEVSRLRKDPPSEGELKGIQNYLAGLFVLRNTSSPDAVIEQLHFVDSQELDRSYLFTYVQKMTAVTPADIQRVTETYITPSKMTVVVVGDQSKVGEQLKPFEAAPQQ